MFVGQYMGGVVHGVTHLILGPPILGRVPYVQKSLSGKVSVAGRGGSNLERFDMELYEKTPFSQRTPSPTPTFGSPPLIARYSYP